MTLNESSRIDKKGEAMIQRARIRGVLALEKLEG
jgi:hypothetical protein